MKPWWDSHWVAEIAHQMALIPLVWLALLAWAGRTRDAAYWWLAVAFAVSWLADLEGDIHQSWVPSAVYPVAQTAIIGAVLSRTRLEAWALFAMLTATAALDIALGGATGGPDVVLRSITTLAVLWMLLDRPELPARLRLALAIYFGLGWATWMIHLLWLSVATWYPYQLCRLAGLLAFAWFVWSPAPSLRVLPTLVRRRA